MIALLKEYSDCFAWDYSEMPGLDRSIIEHQLPLKKGFRLFQQRARQMRTEVLEEVKKERENAGGRVHQAVHICRVDFQHCTCTEEGWSVVSLRGFQGPH
jgi:hypothetical protein